MRTPSRILPVLSLLLAAGLAGSAAASSISAKIWNAELTGNDPALLYGVSASLDLGETLWISGMYLFGTYEDVDGMEGIDYDTADGEVMIGMTFDIMDIGIGARYSEWTLSDDFGNELDLAILGPMAYVGLGSLIGDLPLGWYAAGSYMFKDLGDAYDNDAESTFEHYNIEGGLFLSLPPLTATAGYRIKKYVDFDDLEFKGITGSLGFGF